MAARHDAPTELECTAMAREYRAQLIDMARTLRADGRRFLFVQLEGFLCSGLGEVDPARDGALWGDYMREVHAALRDAGADAVDTRDALSGPGLSLRPADTHPNAAGHASIGKRVAAGLVASGALDACRADGALAS